MMMNEMHFNFWSTYTRKHTVFENHRKSLIFSGQTVLPDSSLEFGQKLVGNATKLKISTETFFGNFQTMCDRGWWFLFYFTYRFFSLLTLHTVRKSQIMSEKSIFIKKGKIVNLNFGAKN